MNNNQKVIKLVRIRLVIIVHSIWKNMGFYTTLKSAEPLS